MCFINELELRLSLKMYIIMHYINSLFVLFAEQQLTSLCDEFFTSGYFYSGAPLIVF